MRRGSNRALMWGTGGTLAVVLGLTAYSALSHDNHPNTPHALPTTTPSAVASGSALPANTPSAVPTYNAPGNWTDPAKWLALPIPAKVGPNGVKSGWPDTSDGAIGVITAYSSEDVEGTTTLADAQLAAYHNYMSAADQSPDNEQKIRAAAGQTDAQQRTAMGIPTSGPMPSGAFMRTTLVGFQIVQASPDEVTAYLLTKSMLKAGETAAEKDSFVVSVLGASWQNGDWKVSLAASRDAATQTAGQSGPGIAAPGDAAFNTDGWTAIRQAS